MDLLQSYWETERLFVRETEKRDLQTLISIFKDNIYALSTQGLDSRPEEFAADLLLHRDLPAVCDPGSEKTFLVLDKRLGRVCGLLSYYCGYPNKDTLYIGSLFLLQKRQRQGLGRELIKTLEQLALSQGYAEARIAVGLKNWPALRFWLVLGFQHISKLSGAGQTPETGYADLELVKAL